MNLTIGSLFSGIGGLELGLERAGVGRTRWQVELDAYCRDVLAHHWPDATRYEDIRHVGRDTLAPVDVICGGFPCQPHSVAGLQRGEDDARFLWPEFARVVRELRPRYVVVENVPNIIADGTALRVLRDFAALGYDAEWSVISAADVGAPQLRERCFIVAYADSRGEPQPQGTVSAQRRRIGNGGAEGMADADGGRCQEPDAQRGRHAEPNARREPMGDAVRAGRGAGAGLAVRRAANGRPPMGDAGGAGRQERDAASLTDGAGHLAGERRRMGDADGNAPEQHEPQSIAGRSGAAEPWSDGVAVRGADGTVRLIPRDAAERGPESPLWPVGHGVPGRVARLRAIGNAVSPPVAEVPGRLIVAREMARLAGAVA